MMKYAIFDAAGFPLAFYDRKMHGDRIPPEAIEMADEQWRDLVNNAGLRRWVGGEVVPYAPPPLPAGPYALTKLQICDRMSDAQLEQFDTLLAQQTTRLRRSWADCTSIDSDHPFRRTLRDALAQAWGEAEAERILARP